MVYLSGALSRIRERVEGRADLSSYLTCLLRELKRSEIADELKVSVDRVDELRKQFLARTEDIYHELFGEQQRAQKKGGA
jgi:hypothetical protein